MNSKGSSSEVTTSQGASSNSGDEFTVPSCSMCNRKIKSTSFCSTCMNYLCFHCEYSHKEMLCFRAHRFVSISGVQNVEELANTLQGDDESKSSSDNSSSVTSKISRNQNLETVYWDGTFLVNDLLGNSYDMNVCLQQMKNWHLSYTNYQNVSSIIKAEKKKLDAIISGSLTELCDLRNYIDLGYDTSSSGSSGLVPNGYLLRAFSTYKQKDGHLSSRNSNLSSGRGSANEPTPSTSRTDVYPYDSSNIPVVAHEPSTTNLTYNTNPDLSLTTTDPDCLPNVNNHVNTMQIHKTFGQKGNGSGQFNSPHGLCLGLNEDIIVADSSNHRIQTFDKFGRFKSQFGVAGRQEGCLWYPRKVALLPSQNLYVICDRGYERSRMQIFTQCGKFIKKIYIQYIDIVAGICVTAKEDIVVVNSVTPTVFIIGQNDFLRTIDCTSFMEEPSDITVVGKEFYICDFKAHNVVVIDEDGNFLRKFGSKDCTTFPNGIDVSLSGYVVVSDSHGNHFHVVVYMTDGTFIAEFRCPYIKVSRCCCLKITQEKRLVTVDKNYHHVIMLEAPFLNHH